MYEVCNMGSPERPAVATLAEAQALLAEVQAKHDAEVRAGRFPRGWEQPRFHIVQRG